MSLRGRKDKSDGFTWSVTGEMRVIYKHIVLIKDDSNFDRF